MPLLNPENRIDELSSSSIYMGAFRFDRVVGSYAASRGRLDPRKKLGKKNKCQQ